MARPDVREALDRLPPWTGERIKSSVDRFVRGLNPNERVLRIDEIDGYPRVVTAKASYTLDHRGNVIEGVKSSTSMSGPNAIERRRLDAATAVVLERCVLLGGSGVPLVAGETYRVAFDDVGLSAVAADTDSDPYLISYDDILGIQVGGPGAQTTGGGFVGGGTLAEGALIGMGVAALLNALSTTSSITTIVELPLAHGELFLLNSDLEPLEMRILLSPAVTRVRLRHGA